MRGGNLRRALVDVALELAENVGAGRNQVRQIGLVRRGTLRAPRSGKRGRLLPARKPVKLVILVVQDAVELVHQARVQLLGLDGLTRHLQIGLQGGLQAFIEVVLAVLHIVAVVFRRGNGLLLALPLRQPLVLHHESDPHALVDLLRHKQNDVHAEEVAGKADDPARHGEGDEPLARVQRRHVGLDVLGDELRVDGVEVERHHDDLVALGNVLVEQDLPLLELALGQLHVLVGAHVDLVQQLHARDEERSQRLVPVPPRLQVLRVAVDRQVALDVLLQLVRHALDVVLVHLGVGYLGHVGGVGRTVVRREGVPQVTVVEVVEQHLRVGEALHVQPHVRLVEHVQQRLVGELAARLELEAPRADRLAAVLLGGEAVLEHLDVSGGALPHLHRLVDAGHEGGDPGVRAPVVRRAHANERVDGGDEPPEVAALQHAVVKRVPALELHEEIGREPRVVGLAHEGHAAHHVKNGVGGVDPHRRVHRRDEAGEEDPLLVLREALDVDESHVLENRPQLHVHHALPVLQQPGVEGGLLDAALQRALGRVEDFVRVEHRAAQVHHLAVGLGGAPDGEPHRRALHDHGAADLLPVVGEEGDEDVLVPRRCAVVSANEGAVGEAVVGDLHVGVDDGVVVVQDELVDAADGDDEHHRVAVKREARGVRQLPVPRLALNLDGAAQGPEVQPVELGPPALHARLQAQPLGLGHLALEEGVVDHARQRQHHAAHPVRRLGRRYVDNVHLQLRALQVQHRASEHQLPHVLPVGVPRVARDQRRELK
ncbi:asparagine synthase B [Babesia caballi]|uniref:Asparagine synthase B n=1 Tax=Babesia caballi TaxID=5871 RepID=A0AAV4LPU0_BABCB|nr:asparagine synthase B [Babesia caballi]